jgi:mannose-6-phosphate isomerase
VHAVRGVVQHYAWGDRTFIPRLLGVEPDGRPWAELWLGTHPAGPATLSDGRPLADVSGPLPYLLKVLAATEPLSLQTHPDAEHARAGYTAGRYADPHAKPEVLCALTRFVAFCGLRPVTATVELLDELGVGELARAVRELGPGGALAGLYRGTIDPAPAVEACRSVWRPETRWVAALDDRYPGDPSVAATLLLNLVELQPGEAIALRAGNLHAYLSGAGIELMGASDNVVRGGLTTKPVDVDDLLAVADQHPLVDPVVPATGEYRLPDTDVRLLRLSEPATHTSSGHELVVATDGTTGYLAPGESFTVEPSTTAFVACGA